MLSMAILGLVLTLAPYAGPALNGSTKDSAKFMVDVRGTSAQTVQLRAVDVPHGYIASFCTNLVCAPFSVTFALPASGHAQIELQLIENETGARKPHNVNVFASGGAHATIAFSRATH